MAQISHRSTLRPSILSLSLLICGGIESIARRHFEISDFLMTLEFFQGICSLNPILTFYMWDLEINKAPSYACVLFCFAFAFELIDATRWNYFSVVLFLSLSLSGQIAFQNNKAIKFLRGCKLFTLGLLICILV